MNIFDLPEKYVSVLILFQFCDSLALTMSLDESLLFIGEVTIAVYLIRSRLSYWIFL
jgi:hypothetical protein